MTDVNWPGKCGLDRGGGQSAHACRRRQRRNSQVPQSHRNAHSRSQNRQRPHCARWMTELSAPVAPGIGVWVAIGAAEAICCALTVLNKAIPAKKMNLSSILFLHSRRFAQVKRKNRCVAAKALSPRYWVSEHAILLLRVKKSLRADERQFSRCKMPPACAREACV